MKLSIIITHYNEPWSICKELFDSIALQKGIDFDDIEVIIANDGDKQLPMDAIEYPYEVRLVTHEHSGVSATRNLGLDNAEGDYVMFCDCDDAFMNDYGLMLVFKAIDESPDVIMSTFLEECADRIANFATHKGDSTFVHGKVYRRQYLIDENIRFKPELTIHEDSYFVATAVNMTENAKEIATPFYLWKWNSASTVRQNPEDYVLKTYDHLINSRIAFCREMNARGKHELFTNFVCKMVFDGYYDFNKTSYMALKNKPWKEKAERAFKRFYDEFREVYLNADTQDKAKLMDSCRHTAYENGMLIESITLKDWLNHITKDV